MKRTMIAVLGAAFALAGCTTYTARPLQSPQAPSTQPAAVSWESTPFDCDALAAEPRAPSHLDQDAARITLCNEPGHEIEQTPPPDALVADPAAVVAVFNELDEANLAVMACTAELGPAYRMVVEYPDGEVVQVRGELYGCRVVGDKVGADRVLAAFTDALLTQRVTQPVTATDPLAGASCGFGMGSWLVPPMDATVAGYRCLGDGAQPRKFTDADWATLRTDFEAHAERRQRTTEEFEACTNPQPDTLTGVSEAGERISLHGLCGVFEFWEAGANDPWVWEPGPEASALLDA